MSDRSRPFGRNGGSQRLLARGSVPLDWPAAAEEARRGVLDPAAAPPRRRRRRRALMLGTDHPFELGDRTPVETVTALGLDAQATRAILWDNAAGLLKMT